MTSTCASAIPILAQIDASPAAFIMQSAFLAPVLKSAFWSSCAARALDPRQSRLTPARDPFLRQRCRPPPPAPSMASVERGTTVAMPARLAAMRTFAAAESLLFSPHAPPATDGLPTLRVIYAYPNTYTVGICSLGFQLVWAALATMPGLAVSRLFADAAEPLPADGVDVLGFSLSWELDYVGIMDTLEYLDVPRRAAGRADGDPIVFGGGPVLTANPEPYAPFFDIVLLGDGEEALGDLMTSLRRSRGEAVSRVEMLRRAARDVSGAYVPALYEVVYDGPTGGILSVTPSAPEVPPSVAKRTYRGKGLATSTVVTPYSAWENIHMVEAVRSCPEMCRFCLASYATLPFRASPVDELIPAMAAGLAVTDRLGILGASVTQHPQFGELVTELADDTKYDGVRVSLSSVRTNTVSEALARMLVARGSKSITVAVESGSARLRTIINKKLDTPDIAAAAGRAAAGGLSSLKLYGMAGLPGEIPSDMDETVAMLKDVKAAGKGLRLTYGCSTFVPKAHTPLQWFGVRKTADGTLKRLGKRLGPLGVDFRPESYKWSVVQALLSRGDRRVADVLELVRGYGDSLGSFKRAFKELRGRLPPLEWYAHEDWGVGEVLPWGHLTMAVSEEAIARHRDEAVSLFRDD